MQIKSQNKSNLGCEHGIENIPWIGSNDPLQPSSVNTFFVAEIVGHLLLFPIILENIVDVLHVYEIIMQS